MPLRWRPAGGEAFVETKQELTVGELAASWERVSPALRPAGLAAEPGACTNGEGGVD